MTGLEAMAGRYRVRVREELAAVPVEGDARALRRFVAERLRELLARDRVVLPAADVDRLVEEVVDDAVGLGPLEPLMRDPTVTEVIANGPAAVYAERRGRLTPEPVRFRDAEHLRHVIERVVGAGGRRVDDASPMVDVRLPDGSRVNAVLPPLALDGPLLTIRRFPGEPLAVSDLIGLGTIAPEQADLLGAAVRGRANVVVSGGTGTGKTTLLNALAAFIGPSERIVTVEDAAELRLPQANVARLESRPPNVEGRGEVTLRALVRNALRMRPDRIVVGRGQGRRGARHAPGDEHRPRRIPHHGARQLDRRCAAPYRDDGPHGRSRPAPLGGARAGAGRRRRRRAPDANGGGHADDPVDRRPRRRGRPAPARP